MTTKVRITERYDKGNLECACIIAGNPALYPEGGLMQTWADRILTEAAEISDEEVGPLFEVA